MSLQTFQSILELSDWATADIEAYDLVGFDGKPVPGEDAEVKGFAFSGAKSGDGFTNVVIGITRKKAVGVIEAGAAIATVDAKSVKSAADGAASRFGVALTAAGDGEFLDILIK